MRLNCRAEGKAQTSSWLAAPTAPWSSRSNRGKGRGVVMGWGLCRRWLQRSQLPWLMATWRDKVWEPGPVRTQVQAGLRGQGKNGAPSGSWGATVRCPRQQLKQALCSLVSGEGCCPQSQGPDHQALSLQIWISRVQGRVLLGLARQHPLCPLRPLLVFSEGTISPKVLTELFSGNSAQRGVCMTCQDKLAAALTTPRASWTKFWISVSEQPRCLSLPWDHHLDLRAVHRWMQIESPGSQGGPMAPLLECVFPASCGEL